MGKMPISTRLCLSLALALTASLAQLHAQDPTEKLPPLYEARRQPTKQEQDHKAALALYGRGLLCERNDRFLEAARILEEAAKLDPLAVPLHKALVPLYLALDRMEEALASCRKILELDPADHETWFL